MGGLIHIPNQTSFVSSECVVNAVVVDEGVLEHAKFLQEDFNMQFRHEIIKKDLTDLPWCFIFEKIHEALDGVETLKSSKHQLSLPQKNHN